MQIRILDVCSGTQSIERWLAGSELKDHVQVVSVDIRVVQGKAPTILTDVLEWDYKAVFKPGHFDIVWASPPCTMYSIARTTGPPRDLEKADSIVRRCLEIIEYLKPAVWIMENPAHGLLRTRDVIAGLPCVIASFCQYGTLYRKDTRFWTNLASDDHYERSGFPKLELKRCNPRTCPSSTTVGGKHLYQLSGDPARKMPGANKWLVGRIPEPLLEHMLGPVVRRIAGVDGRIICAESANVESDERAPAPCRA